jgi:predicted TIM-barrel fold metal-dependent hydrolase
VVQIRAEPAAGKSLAHPDFESFWSTVEDLNMTIMLHVGGGRAPLDPGWIDNGGHPMDYSLMHNAFVRRLVPELTFSALILRGVLERHPRLSIIVAELGVHWLPGFSARLDGAVKRASEGGMGPGNDFSHLKLEPSEYLQRQVRVAMLASEAGLAEGSARPRVCSAPRRTFRIRRARRIRSRSSKRCSSTRASTSASSSMGDRSPS